MARGFLLFEILIALAVMSITMTALSLSAFGLPLIAKNAEIKLTALQEAREMLEHLSTSTDPFYISTLMSEPLEDETFTKYTANVAWKNLFGITQDVVLSHVSTSTSADTTCDPFVSRDWSAPELIASIPIPGTISDMAVTSDTLVVTLGSTTSTHDPTLLSYQITGRNSFVFKSGFDNASTSRIGFSSVAAGDGFVFAGNAFTSISAATCSDGISCSQVQTFSLGADASLNRISSLALSTSSAPFAVSMNGIPSPVQTLTYDHSILYVGLAKTNQGDEFDVLDVQDAAHPAWRSGYSIGRTVNHITVRSGTAYLSTDDPARELMIFDIRTTQNGVGSTGSSSTPTLLGSWNAPGSSSFGYGTASTAHGSFVRFGRSYSSNAPEFSVLDVSNSATVKELQHSDSGTARDPESVRSLVTQSQLTFVLLTHRLEFWNTNDPQNLTSYAPPYSLPNGSLGVAFACRNDELFLARTMTDGTSIIDILRGS